MATPNSVRAELAAAVRAVNAAFNRLPAHLQDRLDVTVDPLEAEVDAAVQAGDRDRALETIAAWRDSWLRRCEEASNGHLGLPTPPDPCPETGDTRSTNPLQEGR
jgi:hypothetical protein